MAKNNIFLLNISDLCEHQRASYYSFLSDGISKELKEMENPFEIPGYVIDGYTHSEINEISDSLFEDEETTTGEFCENFDKNIISFEVEEINHNINYKSKTIKIYQLIGNLFFHIQRKIFKKYKKKKLPKFIENQKIFQIMLLDHFLFLLDQDTKVERKEMSSSLFNPFEFFKTNFQNKYKKITLSEMILKKKSAKKKLQKKLNHLSESELKFVTFFRNIKIKNNLKLFKINDKIILKNFFKKYILKLFFLDYVTLENKYFSDLINKILFNSQLRLKSSKDSFIYFYKTLVKQGKNLRSKLFYCSKKLFKTLYIHLVTFQKEVFKLELSFQIFKDININIINNNEAIFENKNLFKIFIKFLIIEDYINFNKLKLNKVSEFFNKYDINNLRLSDNSYSITLLLVPNQIMLVNPTQLYLESLYSEKSYTIQIHLKAYINFQFNLEIDTIGFINFFEKTNKNFNLLIYEKLINKFKKYICTQQQELRLTLAIENFIFLGEIPFMSDEGTFLVTGVERVVVSQIVRSPGIYFQRVLSEESKNIYYTANIITTKAKWIKFHLLEIEQICEEFSLLSPRIEFAIDSYHEKNFLYDSGFKLTDIYKDRILLELFNFEDELDEDDVQYQENLIFLYDFLRFLGLTRKEVKDCLKYPADFDKHDFSDYLYKKVKSKNSATLMLNLFNCFAGYDSNISPLEIGEYGRLRMNQKFGSKLPLKIFNITVSDLLSIIDGLNDLKYHNGLADDIDHIKNKRVRNVGELIQLQLELAFVPIKNNFMREIYSDINGNYNLFQGLIENIFGNETLLFDPRLFTGLVKKFFKTSPLSHFMDQINPLAEMANKRKISAFGPQGLNREYVSTKVRDIHPSQYGRLCPIETPEGQNAGLISSLTLFGRIDKYGLIKTPYFFLNNGFFQKNKAPIYLNPGEETKLEIGYSDIALDHNDFINLEHLSVKQNYSFLLKATKQTKFLLTSPLQIFSLLTSLIPFMEHNDGNRSLMGANMQRQSVPLLFPQKPIVGTGLECAAILDSKTMLKAISEGEVRNVNSQFIEIEENFTSQKYCYRLIKYLRSNQNTTFNQNPIVWPGEKVYSGQIIADGPSSLDGELCLGRNLLVGYMPWEGYNFEDAIIMNENLLFTDALTSVHIFELNIRIKEGGQWQADFFSKRRAFGSNYNRRHLNKNSMIQIGSYVRANDILCGTIYFPPEGHATFLELFHLEITHILFKNKVEEYKNYRIRRNSAFRLNSIHDQGRVIDVRYIYLSQDKWLVSNGHLHPKTNIYLSIAQIRKIEVGDKLSGRHGNKGVISKILSTYDMPYLPDGKPLDLILNPLGVPSRMNVGQLFECLLGFAGSILGKRFKVIPFDEIYGKEASKILVHQKLIEARQTSAKKWVYDFEKNFYRGKIFLRDGRTGEYFDNPITVGRSYILKLIHLVEDKIHGRNVGPYSLVTEQPLAGKSQNGGQRFGEMEVWALEAHGCSTTLQELFSLKSDDITGRGDLMMHLVNQPNSSIPFSSMSEGFLLLIRELNSLGFDFSFRSFRDQDVRLKKGFHIEDLKIFSLLEDRLKLRAYIYEKNWELLFAESKLKHRKRELEMEKKKKSDKTN